MRRRMGRGFGLAIVTFVAVSELPTCRLRAQAPAATPPPKVVLKEPIIVAAPEPAPTPSPYAGLDQSGFLNRLVTTGVAANRETGSWSAAYSFDQALFVSSEDPTKSWGLFGNAGYSDGNPNPVRWIGNLSVGGASPITGRKLDSFGAGYFHVGLSDSFKNLAPRLLPVRDEHGMEFFYNVAVTPWCHVTPDFQVVLPGRDRNESAVGIRAKIDF